MFNPSKINSDLYRKAEIGEFNNCEFYKTPDVQPLITGDADLATATVNGALSAEGVTSIVLAGAATNGVFKKGQGFSIAGVDAVDIYGESIGSPYIFVAQSDATVAAGAVTISIKPVYFTGPGKNVSTATIATSAVVTQLQDPDSRYLGGIIWDKTSLIFANAKMAPVTGTEEKTVVTSGLAVSTMKGPDIKTRTETVRWDTLSSELLARTNHGVAIWLKV